MSWYLRGQAGASPEDAFAPVEVCPRRRALNWSMIFLLVHDEVAPGEGLDTTVREYTDALLPLSRAIVEDVSAGARDRQRYRASLLRSYAVSS